MNAKLCHAFSLFCASRALPRIQSVLLILVLSALMLLFSIATTPAQSLPTADRMLLAQATPGHGGLDESLGATAMATVAALPLTSDVQSSHRESRSASRPATSTGPLLEVMADCSGRAPADGADHLSVIKPCESYWYGAPGGSARNDQLALARNSTPEEALLPAARGSGPALVENNESASSLIVARPSPQSGSRSEPVFWVLGAMAVCGLGVAGLRGPWMGARFAKPRRSWK